MAKQLQNLYDRIPQRGPATNVILTLLDICRTAQAQNTNEVLTLKPLQQPQEQAKKLSICNGSSCAALEDKGTNTSLDNLVWQQFNEAGCRFMISDKCDNDNHLNVKCSNKGKCCEANNKTTTITCSSNSINFDNLQLQCMCSSDNNSFDEHQANENCDNCSSLNPGLSPPPETRESNSFRERLLNLTSANMRLNETHGNSLRKRNSELVLGTSFESTPMNCSASQSYRISCDNIFSNKTASTATSTALSERHKKESNHSLSTEFDQRTQIPYSFLERPTMKFSQSEDRNLRELKIALSSTLASANNSNNSTVDKCQVIGNLKSSQTVTQQSQSCTSSSSSSSKVDKISFSLSTSSTSEALLGAIKKPQNQQNNNNLTNADVATMTDENNKQREIENINNRDGDHKADESETVMASSIESGDNKSPTPVSNVHNTSVNNGNNGNAKKRKTPEKLAIDLNDRSKYTEEVSV